MIIVKKINAKLFFTLFTGFVAATIIGTVSHESGHYIAAKFLGLNAHIGYAYTRYFPTDNQHCLTHKERFLFTIGGPILTLIAGTIGLFLIIFKRKSFKKDKLTIYQWLMIFLSMFWLRQSANLIMGLIYRLFYRCGTSHSDEIRIDFYLNLPYETVSVITGLIGFIILAYITFWLVPKKQRLTFLAAGLTGGISGFVLWIVYFGKYIMP
jgi:hypothetical protein